MTTNQETKHTLRFCKQYDYYFVKVVLLLNQGMYYGEATILVQGNDKWQ